MSSNGHEPGLEATKLQEAAQKAEHELHPHEVHPPDVLSPVELTPEQLTREAQNREAQTPADARDIEEVVAAEDFSEARDFSTLQRRYFTQQVGSIFNLLIKVAVILIVLFPFYWMLITSFKPYLESIEAPPTLWPREFSMEGILSVTESGLDVNRYAMNTVIVTVSVTILQALVAIPAAYAFAHREFPLKRLMWIIVLIAFMIPGQLTYITVYLMMSSWRLMNTLWPQIIPHAASAFSIFMLRQAMKQVPEELVESARLDHASDFQIMTRIVMPMCKSTIATILLFSFIGTWNSYFWPLVMTNSDHVRPLTIFIQRLRDAETGLRWNSIMAANLVLVGPILLAYLFANKKIIEGFAYRGMK